MTLMFFTIAFKKEDGMYIATWSPEIVQDGHKEIDL